MKLTFIRRQQLWSAVLLISGIVACSLPSALSQVPNGENKALKIISATTNVNGAVVEINGAPEKGVPEIVVKVPLTANGPPNTSSIDVKVTVEVNSKDKWTLNIKELKEPWKLTSPNQFTVEVTVPYWGEKSIDWSAERLKPEQPPGGKENEYANGVIKIKALLPIDISVNDTTDPKDDMVRREQKIGTTAWRQWIPCTVKIPESGPGKTITSIGVTAESGTMKFSDAQAKPENTDAGAANVNVTLDALGQGKFWITGITQSATKGDAKLQIRKNGATGEVLATQPMTVFWFENTIKAEKSKDPDDTAITLSTDRRGFGIYLGSGMRIESTASVVPTGLDHTKMQIADWRLVIVQNVTTTLTWRGQNMVNNVTIKGKGVYQTTKHLDTILSEPDFVLGVIGMDDDQKFNSLRPASCIHSDPPTMPADVGEMVPVAEKQKCNNQQLIWYESDMQNDFTIWSGLIEVTNGKRGSVFIPIK